MQNIPFPKVLTSFDLKIIALVTMMTDHFGYIFMPEHSVFRIIGRMTFILYAFMLAEGVMHTHDIKKYIRKIALWAVLSEFPYDLALYGRFFYLQHQNVFFTLLIAILGLYSFKSNIHIFLKIFIGLLCLVVARTLKVDYSWYGVLVIFIFYLLRNMPVIKFASVEAVSFLFKFKLQIFAFLGFIPIILYNGKLGRKIGNIYYSFYALHLLLFGIIKYHYLFRF